MALAKGTNCGFCSVAPTADPDGVGGTMDGNVYAIRDVSPENAVAIIEIGWWRTGTSTSDGNFEVGVYTDGAGIVPDSLLSGYDNSNVAGTTTNVWLRVPDLSIAISPNTQYWIAVQMDAVSGSVLMDTSGSGGYRASKTGVSALPSPWGGGGNNAGLCGIYALYETGGGIIVPVIHNMFARRRRQ